jgi:hypothetical protein
VLHQSSVENSSLPGLHWLDADTILRPLNPPATFYDSRNNSLKMPTRMRTPISVSVPVTVTCSRRRSGASASCNAPDLSSDRKLSAGAGVVFAFKLPGRHVA